MTENLATRMDRIETHRRLLQARAEQRLVDAAIRQASERIAKALARPAS